MNKNVEKAINDQINAEMYSAYLYLSMAAQFEDMSLEGFANWMSVQAQEEMSHAMKFYSYINERGGRVLLKAIDAPPTSWDSPVVMFEEVLSHEQKVTSLINGLVDVAQKEKDRASESFLTWFIDEQVEEEATAEALLQKLKMVQDAPGAMFMMDKELGQRVFTPPADMED